ncbi:MAG: hypothetical protein D6692_13880 [Planctomycetota bacterium]|nr:MAG: hypothetical protein D6692_13880 [Planctomycetota bacterium]
MHRNISILTSAALAAVAGTASAGQPELSGRATLKSNHVAHIYYNIATGEKVATLLDGGARPASDAGSEVWICANDLPCAGFGQTGGFFGVMDTPNCTTCFTSTATGLIFLDWGDLPFDTVIDCVGITWATQSPDVDLDGDGLGDGVPGFGGFWAWFDGDNGFDSSATRQGLVGIGLFDLPGQTGPIDPNTATVYTATIDLASSFSSSLAFEIGDTDSSSTASIFNPLAGVDQDSDGLAEFSYALQFVQPGTFDWDSDGVLDGDVADQALNGWSLAAPDGTVTDNGDGTWTFDVTPGVPNGTGAEDAFDIFTDLDDDGVFEPLGTFWYGGINCSSDPAVFNPVFAQFYMILYSPGSGPVCPADLAPPVGVLNIFDIQAYIALYNAQDPAADLAAPFGVWNIFDIQAYIASYNAGCP